MCLQSTGIYLLESKRVKRKRWYCDLIRFLLRGFQNKLLGDESGCNMDAQLSKAVYFL